MKEKLTGVLGTFGFIIFWIITSILTFMPLTILHWSFWLDILVITIVLFIPVIGNICMFILWAVTLPMVILGPFDIVAIFYYVALAIYVFAYIIPFLLTVIRNRR